MSSQAQALVTEAPSTWSPLGNRVYRSLWTGALASNVGLWIQSVVGSWDMTSLGPSPVYVALLQTAASLPVLLVGLPAAALGDIVDRRRMLLGVGAWMAAVSLVLAGLSATGGLGPLGLLGLTFALGLGTAFAAPVWQAVLPRLVDRSQLMAAITLSGVAINIARAVGPAVGGLALGLLGSAPVYLLNAAMFAVMTVQVARWRPAPEPSPLPPERVLGAIVAGLRFARHAPALRSVLLRTGVFIAGASALWALLPVVARRELGLGPLGFGALLGCAGAGSLLGAAIMPKLRARLGVDAMAAAATVLYAASTLGLAMLRVEAALWGVLVVAGFAWICLMSSLNVAAASAAPGWVQSRALGVYLLVFQGGFAGGSLAWGALATRSSTSTSLTIAAAVLVMGLAAGIRHRLAAANKEQVAPWSAYPDPVTRESLDPEAGPVKVERSYTVAAADRAAFLVAARDLEEIRRRDGALDWGLFEEVEAPGRFVEYFSVASWGEHLRQHRRAVVADREVEERIRALCASPSARHLIDAYALAEHRKRRGPEPASPADAPHAHAHAHAHAHSHEREAGEAGEAGEADEPGEPRAH